MAKIPDRGNHQIIITGLKASCQPKFCQILLYIFTLYIFANRQKGKQKAVESSSNFAGRHEGFFFQNTI